MKFPKPYVWRWWVGLWWYNHVKRHWHSTALFAWWYGEPKMCLGKITPEMIAWAEGVFDKIDVGV